jgi:uncharacterized protein YbjQ (UPF0145 family)
VADLIEMLLGFVIFLALLSVGYFAGRIAESRHYRSIEARERELLNLPVVMMKNALDEHKGIAKVDLVSGNIVVSVDYFKRFLASLRNVFGGRVTSYESLLDRARREALLRMKETAKGADIIVNLRMETASISKGVKNTIGSVEVLVYGTAVTYDKYLSQASLQREGHSKPSVIKAEPGKRPISEPRYKVIFAGEIAPGQNIEHVKLKVAALYKVPVERCEGMFTGRLVTIKDNLDYQTAQKYKAAFERTGAICRIETV